MYRHLRRYRNRFKQLPHPRKTGRFRTGQGSLRKRSFVHGGIHGPPQAGFSVAKSQCSVSRACRLRLSCENSYEMPSPKRQKREGNTVAPVFVRLDQDLRDWFEAFCKDSGRSQNRVITRLLEYLRKLEDFDRNQLLESQVVPAFSVLLERLEWATHAFSKTYWTWSLQEFQEVEHLADKLNASGIRWLARYKESYCWLDIAMFWRNQALQDGPRGFTRACTAVRNSLVLSQNHLDHTQHRVIFFNVACAWSLLAQFEVEEQLMRKDSPCIPELKKGPEAWSTIGNTWRNEIADKLFTDKIDSYAKKALYFFRLVAERDDTIPPLDHAFLLRSWESDLDFLFLRNDEEHRKLFRDMATTALSTHSLKDAFDALSRRITDAQRTETTNWKLVELGRRREE
jgi:hypothetical protein